LVEPGVGRVAPFLFVKQKRTATGALQDCGGWTGLATLANLILSPLKVCPASRTRLGTASNSSIPNPEVQLVMPCPYDNLV
jgi:hypothetical protein